MTWVAWFLGKAKDLRSRNPNLVAWLLSNYVTLGKSPLWASHLHIIEHGHWTILPWRSFPVLILLILRYLFTSLTIPCFQASWSLYRQEKGQTSSRQAQHRWTATFNLSCAAELPQLPRLRASVPPFPVTTVASEQQLGLASRLNTGSPSPRLLPTCRLRAQSSVAMEDHAACPPTHPKR